MQTRPQAFDRLKGHVDRLNGFWLSRAGRPLRLDLALVMLGYQGAIYAVGLSLLLIFNSSVEDLGPYIVPGPMGWLLVLLGGIQIAGYLHGRVGRQFPIVLAGAIPMVVIGALGGLQRGQWALFLVWAVLSWGIYSSRQSFSD